MNKSQERNEAIRSFREKLQASPEFAQGLNYNRQSVIELVPTTHIVTAKVEGKTIEFVTSNGIKEVGKQTFGADKLDSGKPLILAQIYSLYAKETVADDVKVQNADYRDSEPANLKNGELTISQDGNLFETPFLQLCNITAPDENSVRGMELPNFPVIEDKDSFKIEGKLPAVLDGASHHFVKLVLRGYTPVVR